MEHRAVLCAGWGTDPVRMRPVQMALEGHGLPAQPWAYTPGGSIDDLAEQLAREVGRSPGLHLVGHSLGGLVVAAAALGPLAGHVLSVTTINAPWRGTWLGYTGGGLLAESLRYGSPVLARLRERLTTHLRSDIGPSWVALGVAGDLGTPPSTSLRPPRGPRMARRLIAATGHSQSLSAPRLVTEVAGHVLASAGTASGGVDHRPSRPPEQLATRRGSGEIRPSSSRVDESVHR